jgi:transcriptional regulator with XRE-family HTH domain
MDANELRARRRALTDETGRPLSQAKLGAELGVPQQTIGRWESGARRISHPRILALALWALEHGAGEDAADDSAAHYAEMAVGWAEAKS